MDSYAVLALLVPPRESHDVALVALVIRFLLRQIIARLFSECVRRSHPPACTLIRSDVRFCLREWESWIPSLAGPTAWKP